MLQKIWMWKKWWQHQTTLLDNKIDNFFFNQKTQMIKVNENRDKKFIWCNWSAQSFYKEIEKINFLCENICCTSPILNFLRKNMCAQTMSDDAIKQMKQKKIYFYLDYIGSITYQKNV